MDSYAPDGSHAGQRLRPIIIHISRGMSNFLSLRDDWNELHATAATPSNVFQSHSFLRHWAEHYIEEPEQIIVISGRVAGRLVMVWPLQMSRRLGVKLVTFMGAPVAQFYDLLAMHCAERPALIESGWKAVRDLGADLFVANNVRADALLRSCMTTEALELPGRTSAPFARLASRVTQGVPGCAYSARDRSNYRRRLRRAAEQGPIEFRTSRPGPDAVHLAQKAVDFKLRTLLEKSVWSPAVSNPRFRKFFASTAGDEDSALRISTIVCKGREIGIDLSFDCKGHTFGHVLASDPDSPIDGIGSVLVHRAFISAANRGMQTFELMAPADAYKLQHADGEVDVSHFAVCFTAKGRVYRELYLRAAFPLLKRAAQKFVAPILARALRERQGT